MNVYVSSSCLAGADNIFEVLDTYASLGLKNVELGSTHPYSEKLPAEKFRQYGFNYLVHHYFPPPRQPFIVNLASQDATILSQSLDQLKKSLDFCHGLGVRLFTFHGGFRADADVKLQFDRSAIAPHDKAFDTFVTSVRELDSYAAARGIKIAVENNVLSEYNVIDGRNELLLFCNADDFTKLWESVPSANIGILLDLGHLKVTSHWLGFDRHDFIETVRDRIFAIHIHDNSGRVDEHDKLDENSWSLEVLGRSYFASLPVILESTGLNTTEIMQQVRLLEAAAG